MFPFLCSACAILLILVLFWADWKKAFWFDELFTYYLARVPLGELWRALTSGTDNNPPLLYLPVGVLLHVIPKAEIATRLPSTLAFLITCWCVFRIARRYTSRWFALAAAFLPWTTFLAGYAVEGRPYACAVCFAALSLYFWREAASTSSDRSRYLVGLALSVAGAVSSHFSATLLVAALTAGELLRTIMRRRIDWLVFASIAAGCVPLLLFLPIIRSLKVVLAGSAFWAIPTIKEVFTNTKEALTSVRVLLGLLIASFLLRTGRDARGRAARVPAYEWISWLVLLLAPLEGYLQSRFTGAFTIRYALVMVIPFSLVLAILFDRISRGSSLAALLVMGVCTLLGIRMLRKAAAEHVNPYLQFEQTIASKLPPGEPVVVGTPLLFLPLHYYAPEPMRSRLLYLTAPDLALQLSGTNTPDVNISHLANFAPLPHMAYASFMQKRQPFVVLMKDTDHFTWLGKQLGRDSVALEKLACGPIGCLYQAEPK